MNKFPRKLKKRICKELERLNSRPGNKVKYGWTAGKGWQVVKRVCK